MKRDVRNFVEKEAVGAARTREVKRAKRKRQHQRMLDYLAECAAKIEANGNPAAAEAFRKTWRRIGNGRYAKAFPNLPA